MKLKLVISDECQSCSRTKTVISDFVKRNPRIDFQIEDLKESNEKGLFIVPALFVNGELFTYGDIDEKQLAEIGPQK